MDFCVESFAAPFMFFGARHFGDYVNGIAAGGYYGAFGSNQAFWGVGRAKDNMALVAAGLCHGLDFQARVTNDPKARATVWMKNAAVMDYLSYVPNWRLNGGINSKNDPVEGYADWNRLHTLWEEQRFCVEVIKGDRGLFRRFSKVRGALDHLSRTTLDPQFTGIGIDPATKGDGELPVTGHAPAL